MRCCCCCCRRRRRPAETEQLGAVWTGVSSVTIVFMQRTRSTRIRTDVITASLTNENVQHTASAFMLVAEEQTRRLSDRFAHCASDALCSPTCAHLICFSRYLRLSTPFQREDLKTDRPRGLPRGHWNSVAERLALSVGHAAPSKPPPPHAALRLVFDSMPSLPLLVLLALLLRANHSASYFQAIPRASLNCAHSCRAMAGTCLALRRGFRYGVR